MDARKRKRTIHRDGYHPSAPLDQVLAANGLDLLDNATATHARPERRVERGEDRYALMADPSTRPTFVAFRQRTIARRKAATA